MAKKDRKRLRREQRKRIKKFDGTSLSHLHRIASQGRLLSAVVCGSSDQADEGVCSVMVLRAGPNGRHVMGAFLIDFRCLGLKDAYGHIGVSEADVAERRDDMVRQGVKVASVELPVVRELVAGAVRWTLKCGFKLPPQTDRWLPVLGEDLDIEAADISRFGGEDGKLTYFGTIPDLVKRLPDGDLNRFMQRPDTEYCFVMPEDDDEFAEAVMTDGEEEQDTEAELYEAAGSEAELFLKVALNWCRDHGQIPERRLGEAARLMMHAIVEGMFKGDDGSSGEACGLDVLTAAVEADPDLEPAMEQLWTVFGEIRSVEDLGDQLDAVGDADEPETPPRTAGRLGTSPGAGDHV